MMEGRRTGTCIEVSIALAITQLLPRLFKRRYDFVEANGHFVQGDHFVYWST